MSGHRSQILSNRSCRNIAFFIMTRVLILYCGDFATKIFLLRPRRSRQEVRRRDRGWP